MTIIATTGEAAIWRLARQDAGRHHHRRPRPQRPARARHRTQQLVPEDLLPIATTCRRPIRPIRWRCRCSASSSPTKRPRRATPSRRPTTWRPPSRASSSRAPRARSSSPSAMATRASQETAYGTYRFNKQKNEPEIVDIMRFPAECVNPPAGINADDWIKDGMKGAKC